MIIFCSFITFLHFWVSLKHLSWWRVNLISNLCIAVCFPIGGPAQGASAKRKCSHSSQICLTLIPLCTMCPALQGKDYYCLLKDLKSPSNLINGFFKIYLWNIEVFMIYPCKSFFFFFSCALIIFNQNLGWKDVLT